MAEGADRSAGADLARYYDLDLAGRDDGDVDLYLALAAAHGGPILELGCGSGRVSLALAGAGHEVVGVDYDADMLDRARGAWRSNGAQAGSLELIESDMLGLELGRRFGIVLLALNTLAMLPGRDAQQQALETMARHLAATGRAVVDVWLPAPVDLAAYDGRLELAWLRTDEETGEQVAKLWAADYEPAGQFARVTTFFDAWRDGAAVRRRTRHDRLTLIGASELVRLAERAGIAVETLGGDYSMEPFGPDSQRAVLVGRLL